jgi:hypothetical protein
MDFRWQQLSRIQEEARPELNGLFPSQRWHPWGYRRSDHSAYFTAIIIQGLLQLEDRMEEEEKAQLEFIRQKACPGLAPFRNSHGLDRYNFWGTNPAAHFPNGKLFRHIPRLRPPDDADDSVMIYQIQKRPAEEALWLKNHIDEYANGNRFWVSNCPEEYRDFRAWCTFFCRDMPPGFDACVISNILFFNRIYKFEPNFKEQDSIRYLNLMLQKKDHLLRPEEVAPYYPETATILFHLARLLAICPPAGMENRRKQLMKEMEQMLGKPLRKMERLLLEIAWLHLDSSRPPVFKGRDRDAPFAFFVLPLTLEYENSLLRWLARRRISHIRFSCPAHEIALELERSILLRPLVSS